MIEHYDNEPSRAEAMLASARAIAELQATQKELVDILTEIQAMTCVRLTNLTMSPELHARIVRALATIA